jgi:hypothetical protein
MQSLFMMMYLGRSFLLHHPVVPLLFALSALAKKKRNRLISVLASWTALFLSKDSGFI